MAKTPSVAEVVEEIYQSILATPKRQRRLLSKTFWDKFGFKVRSKERVEQVREELNKRKGLIINLDASKFGTEDKDEWIILTHVESPGPPIGRLDESPARDVPMPDDSWFDLIEQREFESEREVEYYFVVPLLEKLGYTEGDYAIEHTVPIFQGTKKVNAKADVVVFNGSKRSKDDALLVIEAKKEKLTEDAVGQAQSYARELTTPFYLVTNGEEIRLYNFRGAVQPDAKLASFNRRELKQQWRSLYETLNKTAVIDLKQRLKQRLETMYS
jgi:hypothetical protein